MSDELHGHVTAIAQEIRGATTLTTTADGATTLYVDDVADFGEEGGLLRLTAAGVTLAPSVLRYSTVDDDTGSITLLDAVHIAAGGPVPAAASVVCWSDVDNAPVAEWVATIADDSFGDTDRASIEVPIGHALVPLLQASVRAGTTESVTATRSTDGQWTVTDVLGKTPTSDTIYARRARAGTQLIEPGTTGEVLKYDLFPNARGDITISDGVWTFDSATRAIVVANVHWDANSTGQRRVWFEINGTPTGAEDRRSPAGGAPTSQSVTDLLDAQVGDQLVVWVAQTNSDGDPLNVLGGTTVTVTGLD